MAPLKGLQTALYCQTKYIGFVTMVI